MKKQELTSKNWQDLMFKKVSEKAGFLLINKPTGPTSHDIIDKLRKITGIRKIGHAGTLDPFASGLLLCAIGREATREISQFVKMNKVYKTRLRLGAVSDTYDKTGKVKSLKLKVKSCSFSAKQPLAQANKLKIINTILKSFIGMQEQLPPMFSAKKVKGKKLYELARAGKTVKRQPHKIKIYYIKLLNYKWPYLDLEIKCSSGTYIRALAHDIGKKTGFGSYVEKLQRIKIGKLSITQSSTC